MRTKGHQLAKWVAVKEMAEGEEVDKTLGMIIHKVLS